MELWIWNYGCGIMDMSLWNSECGIVDMSLWNSESGCGIVALWIPWISILGALDSCALDSLAYTHPYHVLLVVDVPARATSSFQCKLSILVKNEIRLGT